MLGTDSRGDIGDLEPTAAPSPSQLSAADLNRMAEGLSCCEALLVADADERRAIMSTLSRHPDRNAVRSSALGRWPRATRDLAVEAALALEDIGATLNTTLSANRAQLAETRTFEAALAVAEVITDAIEAGVADAPLVPGLAREARQGYQLAGEIRSDAILRPRRRADHPRMGSAKSCTPTARSR